MGDTESHMSGTNVERPDKIKLTDEEWRAKLTPQQYSVCRAHGTEAPFTGELLNVKGNGTFVCSCCGAALFSSSTKFDSGSGWPSFFDALKEPGSEMPVVDIKADRSHGMVRTEVICGKCDSHLGHVFNDGPLPTGLRYCINSVSLQFQPESSSKK